MRQTIEILGALNYIRFITIIITTTNPSIGQLIMKLNGQAERTQNYIGQGQAKNKQVRRSMKSSMSGNGVHDHRVSGHSEGDNDHVDTDDGSLLISPTMSTRRHAVISGRQIRTTRGCHIDYYAIYAIDVCNAP